MLDVVKGIISEDRFGLLKSTSRERITVIIPTYNRKDYLARALNSLVNQSNGNFNVVVYDDGSSDGTHEIIPGYKEDLHICYVQGKNSGRPAKARNNAIKHAAKENVLREYIAFLDSDDWWDKDMVESLYRAIEADSFDVYYTGGIVIESKRQSRHRVAKNKRVLTSERLVLGGNCVLMSSLVIRRETGNFIGWFDTSARFTAWEDYDLVIRLAMHGASFYYIDKELCNYDHNDTSITDTSMVRKTQYRIKECLENGRYGMTLKLMPAWWHYTMMISYIEDRSLRDAVLAYYQILLCRRESIEYILKGLVRIGCGIIAKVKKVVSQRLRGV